MGVDRCCCLAITFAELLELARRERLDADALMQRTGCGKDCGMCAAYLRVMLSTGLTDLPVLDPKSYARLMGLAHDGPASPTDPLLTPIPKAG